MPALPLIAFGALMTLIVLGLTWRVAVFLRSLDADEGREG